MTNKRSKAPAPPVQATPTPTRRAASYDWTTWADGQPRAAVQGEHFTVVPSAFIAAGHAWAKRNGCTFRSSVSEDQTTVRFTLTRESS